MNAWTNVIKLGNIRDAIYATAYITYSNFTLIHCFWKIYRYPKILKISASFREARLHFTSVNSHKISNLSRGFAPEFGSLERWEHEFANVLFVVNLWGRLLEERNGRTPCQPLSSLLQLFPSYHWFLKKCYRRWQQHIARINNYRWKEGWRPSIAEPHALLWISQCRLIKMHAIRNNRRSEINFVYAHPSRKYDIMK